MKAGGKGACAGAAVAATTVLVVLLVAAAQLADADDAVARRLGTGRAAPPVSDDALSGPKPNPCTHDPNNPGQKCHDRPGQQEAASQSSPAVSVNKATTSGHNNCTFDPNDPTGKKCHYPPLAAP